MTMRTNAAPNRHPITVWGSRALLDRAAVGICGSRHADERALELADQFGRLAAKRGFVLVSGDAKGVDDAAQYGALRAGGSVISVLAEGLGGWKPRVPYRPLITGENYAAVSEFPAEARWLASRAMQRNRTIIDLSCAFVVVQAGDESGGTWEAGLTCLRLGKPLLVVQREERPETEGNAKLIARGGIAVATTRGLVDLLDRARDGALRTSPQLELPATA